ncbi:MAG: formylglycine-generating enzyme family protein [Spirochaetia bacterium]|nr:formylglycine-generating enzyme family protein [Spirochaetia bacterium]
MRPSIKNISFSFAAIFILFSSPLLSFEGKVYSVKGKTVEVVGNRVTQLKPGQKFGVYSGLTKTGEIQIQQTTHTQAKARIISGSAGKGAVVKVVEVSKKAEAGGMNLVRGGTFKMGDTFGDGGKSEKPVHRVTVSDFYLGKRELTRGEFRTFVSETGYKTTAEKKSDVNTWQSCMGMKQMDSHPVICVSWYDAIEYCNWRSKKEGLTAVYGINGENVNANWQADGYRLPTEAEWEYAARSGGKKEKYSGTSDEGSLGEYAWYNANSNDGTHPVGEKKANALGLYDMSGNVVEWVWDWYGEKYYKKIKKANPIDPVGPNSGLLRVFRGASWGSAPRGARSSYRFGFSPDIRISDVGFLLSRSGSLAERWNEYQGYTN